MVNDKQRERAAESWLREHAGATQTHRAVRTQWAAEDLFGADVIAFATTPWGSITLQEFLLCQATTLNGVSERLQRLERREHGEGFVKPAPWERRLLLAWYEKQDPDDGRRKLNFFRVYELRDIAKAEVDDHLTFDGRSRRPVDGWVWAQHVEPYEIPGGPSSEWYTARGS